MTDEISSARMKIWWRGSAPWRRREDLLASVLEDEEADNDQATLSKHLQSPAAAASVPRSSWSVVNTLSPGGGIAPSSRRHMHHQGDNVAVVVGGLPGVEHIDDGSRNAAGAGAPRPGALGTSIRSSSRWPQSQSCTGTPARGSMRISKSSRMARSPAGMSDCGDDTPRSTQCRNLARDSGGTVHRGAERRHSCERSPVPSPEQSHTPQVAIHRVDDLSKCPVGQAESTVLPSVPSTRCCLHRIQRLLPSLS